MTITNATLTINSKQYDILNFCYKFQRNIDAKGRPRGVYYGGEILVQMESTDDSELFRQTVDKKTTPVSGYIETFSGDGTCVRRIDFEKAYLCALGEEMQNDSSLPMTTTLSISPMRLDFNNTLRLDRCWPEAPHGWQKYEAKEEKYAKDSQKTTSKIFDEQIRVVDYTGAPIADLLYYVEYNNKKVLSGRTNAEGLTERIESGATAEEYTVYWGEDALIKIQNSL